jgi:hypothetical protein
MKHKSDRAIGLTIILLTFVHVVAFGAPAAKRVVWLIRRYPHCNSSEQEWRTKTLKYPQIVAAVRTQVPEQASLTVRHADIDLGLEVAFYAFPRRVFFVKTSETEAGRFVLRPVGSDTWVVSVE